MPPSAVPRVRCCCSEEDTSSLWQLIVREFKVTREQRRALKAQRERFKILSREVWCKFGAEWNRFGPLAGLTCKQLNTTMQTLRQLRELAEAKNSDLDAAMADLQSIVTPTQV